MRIRALFRTLQNIGQFQKDLERQKAFKRTATLLATYNNLSLGEADAHTSLLFPKPTIKYVDLDNQQATVSAHNQYFKKTFWKALTRATNSENNLLASSKESPKGLFAAALEFFGFKQNKFSRPLTDLSFNESKTSAILGDSPSIISNDKVNSGTDLKNLDSSETPAPSEGSQTINSGDKVNSDTGSTWKAETPSQEEALYRKYKIAEANMPYRIQILIDQLSQGDFLAALKTANRLKTVNDSIIEYQQTHDIPYDVRADDVFLERLSEYTLFQTFDSLHRAKIPDYIKANKANLLKLIKDNLSLSQNIERPASEPAALVHEVAKLLIHKASSDSLKGETEKSSEQRSMAENLQKVASKLSQLSSAERENILSKAVFYIKLSLMRSQERDLVLTKAINFITESLTLNPYGLRVGGTINDFIQAELKKDEVAIHTSYESLIETLTTSPEVGNHKLTKELQRFESFANRLNATKDEFEKLSEQLGKTIQESIYYLDLKSLPSEIDRLRKLTDSYKIELKNWHSNTTDNYANPEEILTLCDSCINKFKILQNKYQVLLKAQGGATEKPRTVNPSLKENFKKLDDLRNKILDLSKNTQNNFRYTEYFLQSQLAKTVDNAFNRASRSINQLSIEERAKIKDPFSAAFFQYEQEKFRNVLLQAFEARFNASSTVNLIEEAKEVTSRQAMIDLVEIAKQKALKDRQEAEHNSLVKATKKKPAKALEKFEASLNQIGSEMAKLLGAPTDVFEFMQEAFHFGKDDPVLTSGRIFSIPGIEVYINDIVGSTVLTLQHGQSQEILELVSRLGELLERYGAIPSSFAGDQVIYILRKPLSKEQKRELLGLARRYKNTLNIGIRQSAFPAQNKDGFVILQENLGPTILLTKEYDERLKDESFSLNYSKPKQIANWIIDRIKGPQYNQQYRDEMNFAPFVSYRPVKPPPNNLGRTEPVNFLFFFNPIDKNGNPIKLPSGRSERDVKKYADKYIFPFVNSLNEIAKEHISFRLEPNDGYGTGVKLAGFIKPGTLPELEKLLYEAIGDFASFKCGTPDQIVEVARQGGTIPRRCLDGEIYVDHNGQRIQKGENGARLANMYTYLARSIKKHLANEEKIRQISAGIKSDHPDKYSTLEREIQYALQNTTETRIAKSYLTNYQIVEDETHKFYTFALPLIQQRGQSAVGLYRSLTREIISSKLNLKNQELYIDPANMVTVEWLPHIKAPVIRLSGYFSKEEYTQIKKALRRKFGENFGTAESDFAFIKKQKCYALSNDFNIEGTGWQRAIADLEDKLHETQALENRDDLIRDFKPATLPWKLLVRFGKTIKYRLNQARLELIELYRRSEAITIPVEDRNFKLYGIALRDVEDKNIYDLETILRNAAATANEYNDQYLKNHEVIFNKINDRTNIGFVYLPTDQLKKLNKTLEKNLPENSFKIVYRNFDNDGIATIYDPKLPESKPDEHILLRRGEVWIKDLMSKLKEAYGEEGSG